MTDKQRKLLEARAAGLTIAMAQRRAKVSRATAYRYLRMMRERRLGPARAD